MSKTWRKLLSVLLALSMLVSLTVTGYAAGSNSNGVRNNASGTKVELEDLDPAKLNIPRLGEISEDEEPGGETLPYNFGDIVRVSIVLDKEATLSKYSTQNVAHNPGAIAYREGLKQQQMAVTGLIERTLGRQIDVKWNLTLAMNAISANVRYGDIAMIRTVAGVKSVELENKYEPQTAEINTATTTDAMVGATALWESGYTGAGTRVAIIDTGTDQDHQSFDPEALEFALAEDGGEYNLLTWGEISKVADQLNANTHKNGSGLTEDVYKNTKIPYAYNYIDGGYITDHMSDTQGEHGSHVSGIAAANRYIKVDGKFVDAAKEVFAVGVAPDAQILTMKVFGAAGGAYDSDYMAAIEDAIILGCDSVNLSLGSGNPGYTLSGQYQDTMNGLVESGTVVSISAGNAYHWSNSIPSGIPYLYLEDVGLHTGGSPGSFANSLTVASANNIGLVSSPLVFNGTQTAYPTETDGYGNEPIATLANEEGYEYVLVDGPGVDDNNNVGKEGDAFLAIGSDVLTGKIAMCYRGDSSFFAKANAAVAQGAIAVIIINNTDGVINMNLTGYEYTAPAVSILKAIGDAVKGESEAVKDDEGNVLYYKGTMTIGEKGPAITTDRADATISDFSSWGVPGSLILKPEITAPGGSIYSVFGSNRTADGVAGGPDQYEIMSGTSMAAPHITGMAALVGQYIRENDLETVTGVNRRTLINSLLMSTATPMIVDGAYLPVIQQGAGLGEAHLATLAKSYITMNEDATASWQDGKVKAELGQDAKREGVYSYSFNINNFSDVDMTYELYTDMFTQAPTAYQGNFYMLLDTMGLDPDEDFAVEYDYPSTSGDLMVPAGQSVTVKVTITYSDDLKAFLDYYYTGGAYVEGYTYVTPTTETKDGEILGVEHSIPILGFYGSWTDASMFDCVSVIDAAYGSTKVSYTGNQNTNYLTVNYGKGDTAFMGNPYMIEDEFPADRLALNTQTDLVNFRYNLIRNAASTGVLAIDGNYNLLKGTMGGAARGAWYYVNGSSWQDTSTQTAAIGGKVGALGVKEHDTFTLGYFAVPEYYGMMLNPGKDINTVTAEDVADLLKAGELGEGAYIGYTFTVDNTAPVIDDVATVIRTDSKTLMVTAHDDRYIASVMIMDVNGNVLYDQMIPKQTDPGQTVTVEIPVTEEMGNGVAVIVGDYACNETAKLGRLSDQPITGTKTVYKLTDSFEADKEYLVVNINEAGEGYAMACTGAADTTAIPVTVQETDDGTLYIDTEDESAMWLAMANGSNFFLRNVGTSRYLGPLYVTEGETLKTWPSNYYDTFSYVDSVLTYVNSTKPFAVYFDEETTLFKLTAAAHDVNKDGKTDKDDAQAILDKLTGNLAEDAAFDEKAADMDGDGKFTSYDAHLLLVWLQDSGINVYLYVKDSIEEEINLDEAQSITVTPEETILVLKHKDTVQLLAEVKPILLENKNVTWTSDDESVATVDENGLVTAVGVGTATITATTDAEPHLTATASIRVEEITANADIRGLIYGDDSEAYWSIFNSDNTLEWQKVAPGGYYDSGALADDTLYTVDGENVFAVDADTYEVTTLGGIVSDWCYSDGVGMPEDMVEAWGIPGFVVGGPCYNGTYFEVLNPEEGKLNYWNLSSAYGSDPMATIAYVGRGSYTTSQGETYENCAFYYMLTEGGMLWKFIFNMEGSLIRESVGATGMQMTGVASLVNKASMVYDEESGYLFLAYYDGNGQTASLYAIDAEEPAVNCELGNFGGNVWPVVSLYQYEPATDLVLKVNTNNVEFFETQTAELKIKVKMGESNEYTAEIADPSIISLENGVITGLKAGETTITVTTKDVNAAGEHLTEIVNVTVKPLASIDADVMAQVTDAQGTRFAKINLKDLTVSSEGYEAPGNVTSGARTGNIYIAGLGTQTKILNPETFEPDTSWNKISSYYAQYPAQDIANYPNFLDEDGAVNDMKALFTTSIGWLVTPDFYGWNLSSQFADMAGIAFLGTDTVKDQNTGAEVPVYDYLMMTSGGILYLLQIQYEAGRISYQALADTGITVDDQSALSLAVVLTDNDEFGLVIANNEDQNLWYFDFNTFEVGLFGKLDAENVSGLIGTFDELATVINPDDMPAPDPLDEADVLFEESFEDDTFTSTWTFVDADEDGYNWEWSNGNSQISTYEGSSCILSRSYYGGYALTPDNWAISPAIDLTDVNDGVLSLYARAQDPEYYAEHFALYAGTTADIDEMTMLTEEIEATGNYVRYTADLSAFAGEKEVYVAVRHFNCTDQFYLNVDKVQVLCNIPTVTPKAAPAVDLTKFAAPELNNMVKIGDGMAMANVVAGVSVEMTKFSETANIVRGGTNAFFGTALLREEPITNDTATDDNIATVEIKEAVEVTNGMYQVTYDPELLTYVGDEKGELDTYSINVDEEKGEIMVAFSNTEALAADTVITTLTFKTTCDDATVTVKTLERNDATGLEETKDVTVEGIGHDWGEPEWTWNEDHTKATAKFVCKNDETHVSEVEDTEIETKTTASTCEEAGQTVYTATVTGPDGKEYTDSQTEAIPATGHDWGEPEWTWNKDHTKATAKFVCKNDETHVKEIEATDIKTQTTDPTCDVDGKTVYTATVTGPDGKEYTDSQTETIPATGHDWCEPEWTWNEDHTKATATFTCKNCGEKYVVVDDGIVTETDKDGKTTYEASVIGPDGKVYTETFESSVNTGDNMNLVLYVSLLAVSAVALVVLFVAYKKRQNRA